MSVAHEPDNSGPVINWPLYCLDCGDKCVGRDEATVIFVPSFGHELLHCPDCGGILTGSCTEEDVARLSREGRLTTIPFGRSLSAPVQEEEDAV